MKTVKQNKDNIKPAKRCGRPKKSAATSEVSINEVSVLQEKADELHLKITQYMRRLKIIEGLLQSYYLLDENGQYNEIVLPQKKTPYWYVRSDIGRNGFLVQSSEWIGSLSDRLRFASGNVYLDRKTANNVCMSKNRIMAIINK